MKNKAFLHIFILIIANALVKPLYVFGVDAEIQNRVGPSDYGLYFALFNFFILWQWLLDPGIQNYVHQKLSKEREHFDSIFNVVVGTKFLTAVIFLFISGTIAIVYFDISIRSNIVLLALVLVCTSFMIFFRSIFSAMGDYMTDALLSVTEKLSFLIVLGYLLYLSPVHVSIELMLKVQLICLVFILICIFALLFRRYRPSRIRFNLARSKELIRSSIPFALVLILMSLYHRMDGVMLEYLIDDHAHSAGVYAAGYRIFDAVNMICILLAGLLLPMYASMIKESSRLQRFLSDSLRLMLAIAISLCTLMILYNQQIMDWLYTDSQQIYHQTFFWLSLSYFPLALTFIFGTAITATGNLRKMNILFLIGIVMNWSINLILIPQSYSVGAAQATLITQCVILIGQIYLCSKQLGYLPSGKLLVHFLAIALGVVLIAIGINQISGQFELKLVGSAIIIGLFILMSRFLRFDFKLPTITRS